MYFQASDEESVCALCDHPIFAGSLCISLAQINEQDVETAEPTAIAVLHIECENCESGESCFVSYASQQSPIEAEDEGVCAYCQHDFQVGQPTLMETILAVNEESQASGEPLEVGALGLAKKAGIGARAERRIREWGSRGKAIKLGNGLTAAASFRPGELWQFKNLSADLMGKLKSAGLGNGRGVRNYAETRQFYADSVHSFIRYFGNVEGLRKFLEGKVGSHIRSVAEHPKQVKARRNVLWELEKANALRGSRSASRLEVIGIKARNAADATRIVGRQMAGRAMRGAALAALFEAPISATENAILYKRGRKSGGDAAKSVAKDTAMAGAFGGAVGAGMILVVAVGGGVVLAPIAMPIAVVGVSIYAVSSVFRIRRALVDEPNDDGGVEAVWAVITFHIECTECESGELCHDGFLRSVVESAA